MQTIYNVPRDKRWLGCFATVQLYRQQFPRNKTKMNQYRLVITVLMKLIRLANHVWIIVTLSVLAAGPFCEQAIAAMQKFVPIWIPWNSIVDCCGLYREKHSKIPLLHSFKRWNGSQIQIHTVPWIRVK